MSIPVTELDTNYDGQQSQNTLNCCGIHAIAVNEAHNYLAISLNQQIIVYQIPTFLPFAIFKGHTDAVSFFTMAERNDFNFGFP